MPQERPPFTFSSDALGFSIAMAAHASSLLDSYTYRFALQEAALPFSPETVPDVAALGGRGV